MVDQSRIVFEGTVLRRSHEGRGAYRIRIDRLLDVPATLADLTDQIVTVEFAPGEALRKRRQYVVFAKSRSFGTEITLSGVFHYPSSGQLAEAVSGRLAAREDRYMTARLQAADLVVAGKVTGVIEPSPDLGSPIISEHFPRWREATIAVASVEKGAFEEAEIRVVFPGTRDVMWAEYPRFEAGQEGIWLLQSAAAPDSEPRLLARDWSDFRPAAELARVRRLLSEPSPPPVED